MSGYYYFYYQIIKLASPNKKVFYQFLCLVVYLYLMSENGNVYCETEAFNATCEMGSAILMTRAHYGRMKLSRCVRQNYGHVGCAADVIDLADARCSGRRKCTIRIPDAILATTKPCPDDLKPYLEADYMCVKGNI